MSKILESEKNKKKLSSKPKDKLRKVLELDEHIINSSEQAKQCVEQVMTHPHYKPVKKQTTIRLDADVIQWLKSQGKGYQTRLNKILREAMLEELKDKTMD